MCLATSNVRGAAQWNWEGDTIIHDPIIVGCRDVLGKKKERYDIDIRGFLANKDNAVLKRTVRKIAAKLPAQERALFYSRAAQSFDLRMRAVTAYISSHVAYEGTSSREFDYWLFPEETLKTRKGDCEDRAFLLASLLLAAGVSSYSVRIALGKIYNQNTKESYDHVWVMYKNESGVWMLIEPLLLTQEARAQTKRLAKKKAVSPEETVEYIPYYVFNDSHLWRLKNNTITTTFEKYLRSRQFWKDFDPKFAAGVHNHIFDEALSELSDTDRMYVKGISMALDINPAIYDPRDHFDNGYIDEGWKMVKMRIGEGTLSGLARAAHTAADFYAHSSYGCFAKKDANDELVLFDPDDPNASLEVPPDYEGGGFAFSRFTRNQSKCSSADPARQWEGKIVSGRFGQHGDQAQGFLEKTFISIPYALRSAPGFEKRTCLPHHNEIAVDTEKKPDVHKLYDDPEEFKKAYERRRKAAVAHIKKIYQEWLAVKTRKEVVGTKEG
jgi:hypothetical protein